MNQPSQSASPMPEVPKAQGLSAPVCSDIFVGIATVMLSRHNSSGIVTTHTICWRQGISDMDTMRGIAVAMAMESKPGFSVDSVLVEILGIPNGMPQHRGGCQKCGHTHSAFEGCTPCEFSSDGGPCRHCGKTASDIVPNVPHHQSR